MNLCNINHSFNYEMEKLCRIFLPHEKIEILDTIKADSIYAVCTLLDDGVKAELFVNDKNYLEEQKALFENEKETELAIASCLYKCFVSATGYTPPWGLLTGVRPVKLYSKMQKNIGKAKTDRYFKEKLFVSDEKISLCGETEKPEQNIVLKSRKDSFSLYI